MCGYVILLLTCWIGKKNLFYQLKNFIYRCFSFVDLLNWSILTKIPECGVMSFCCWLVELRKSFSCNSKKIDIGVCFGRWLVELDYPAISECEGMSFSCWLVELRKNLFHQLKNFIYRFFSAVDLLNWTFVAKISKFGGLWFSCWLVELRKNLFHQLKNFLYRCFFGRWLVELDFPS